MLYRPLLTAFLASALAAGAAEGLPPTYTVEELQRLAFQHNGIVQATRHEVAAAQAGIASASAYPNPELELMAGRFSPRQPTGLDGNDRWIFLGQRLENPWLRDARISGAEAFAGGRQAFLESTLNDVSAEIRVRAYQVLLRQEEAKAAADALALLEQTRARVKVRVDQGETGRYDLIRADAEVLNARQRRDTALLEAERSRLAVNQLAGGILPPSFEVRASLLDVAPLPTLQQLQQQALQTNPEFRQLEATLAQARARIDQEKAARVPSVGIQVGQTQNPAERELLIGLNVAIPVWDRRKGPILEATAQLGRVEALLENRRRLILQEMDSAAQAYLIAQRRVEALEKGVMRDAEAAVRVAEAAYRFGERGILDFLDAQRVLRAVRADLLTARYDLQVAAAAIDRLRGAYPKGQTR
jgi:cobalt-zinc-cadmium efflux system outer membrane protein